jgi:anti-sigma factor RsiW
MHFDGELAPAEAASVERHLASCSACNDRLGSMLRLREMVTVSSEQAASQVDFEAMFSRIEEATRVQPGPGLIERLGVWIREALEHNPSKVWLPAGAAFAAAAAAVIALTGAEQEREVARRPAPRDPYAPKAAPMMLAENETANASEVVQVDFGSNTGTVFEIALADGASTPVVWINDEE